MDRQLPDGTVVWTSPSGQSYTTEPGSRLLFPSLCRPTARVVVSAAEVAAAVAAAEAQPGRGLAMPRRRRTRAQDRAARIAAERRLNQTQPQPRETAVFTARAPAESFASWFASLPPGDDSPPPF
jgi:hypothetical protein